MQKEHKKESNSHHSHSNLSTFRQNPSEGVFDNQIRLLDDPKEAWQARIDLIEKAKRTIEVESYAFHGGDGIIDLLLGLLMEAADRGVKVRLILDSTSHGLGQKKLSYLVSHQNIEARFYQPFWEKPRLSSFTKFLHDKVLIVDEEEMIAGGRNIGDKYYERGEKQFCRDRDFYVKGNIRSEGSAPVQARKYFNSLWESEKTGDSLVQRRLKNDCLKKWIAPWCKRSKEKLLRKRKRAGLEIERVLLIEKNENPHQFERDYDWSKKSVKAEKIKFIHDPIGEKKETNGTARALYGLFDRAKKEIVVNSPFVIPTKKTEEALVRAHKRGVKISILTNSLVSSDNLLLISGTKRYQRNLMKRAGAEYWEYQGADNLHQKAYLIDDKITILGSYNLDSRSARLNTEVHYVIESREFTDQMRKVIKEDMKQAVFIGKESDLARTNKQIERRISPARRMIFKILQILVPLYSRMS